MYKRIWASTYEELNDPMEGAFTYDDSYKYLANSIRSEKSRTFICSFSKNYTNGLMWSFYANEHKGCCIELEVSPYVKNWRGMDVVYKSNLAAIDSKEISIDDILCQKSIQWKYEDEYRYIKTTSLDQKAQRYLKVIIKKIYLGIRMSDKDKRFFKKLINMIDPEIDVIEIKKEDIDFGFDIR